MRTVLSLIALPRSSLPTNLTTHRPTIDIHGLLEVGLRATLAGLSADETATAQFGVLTWRKQMEVFRMPRAANRSNRQCAVELDDWGRPALPPL